MARSIKNFLYFRKIPTFNGDFTFNRHFGLEELILPSVKDLNTLLNDCDGIFGFLFENFSKLNLVANLLANLV